MGRDGQAYCEECRLNVYLGYGSYSSWADGVLSVAAYDEWAERHPNWAGLLKNQNLRRFLGEHEGHEGILVWSGDWLTHNRVRDVLEWAVVFTEPEKVYVERWSEVRREDWWEEEWTRFVRSSGKGEES